jgi:P27 family predicted phage terminase small subunit
MAKSKLHVVSEGDVGACPAPPRPLGDDGAKLWQAIQAEYVVTDSGGVELLLQACESLDYVQECRRIIERDGMVSKSKGGMIRDHPLLRHQLAARSFISRCISKLGLDVEAIRPSPGRPGGW